MQLLGALALILGWSSPAAAKKKKIIMDTTAETAPAEPTGPVAPEPDTQGHVNFGNPTAENLGRVSVTAPSGTKVQVYLDGRYFGEAPITIYSVPAGDYIVEGTVVPSGKQLSRPVSVTANEEAAVDIGAGKIESPVATETKTLPGDLSPGRMRATKILLVAGIVGIAAGITFGILEKGAESDYENTPIQLQDKLDSIRSRGNRDALISNVGFGLAGAALVGAAFCAYPLFIKPAEKAQTAIIVAPLLNANTTGGMLALRF
jgi:hypothetical protein